MIKTKVIQDDLYTICKANINWNKLENSSVLVTGASGLIGQYLVLVLNTLNELYNLKINVFATSRNLSKYKNIWFPINLIESDIVNLKLPNGITHILHTAGLASSDKYNKFPCEVINTSFIGTKQLLDYSIRNKTSFLYFSSGEVFGETSKTLVDETYVGVLDHTKIRSCYGESKRLIENLCLCYNHQYGIDVRIVRPDHTYGPTVDLNTDARVFAQFVKNIVLKENISLKSTGEAIRTFCYLSDATDGYFRVLLNGVPGNIYNVSNPNGRIKIIDLANTLISMFSNYGLKVIYSKHGEGYLDNPHQNRPSLDVTKLTKLGYYPKIDIETGFYRTIQSLTESFSGNS